MFLKRLELNGFKSFAGKTDLSFPEGITAIVGPNGSGKSNVTDAIRWLLGEREAKNLRGVKADDLIFAGTPKRPRVGLAQATLYFDNSSGFFPVDYKEVSISRKVSRDGTSEFSLNKSEIRLKDLVDFLAKVRLGARGLTIIGQGESDLFIKASPRDRREMIEEVLGLKEYQLKKIASIRSLKNTSFNLEKVGAMLEELKPRLRLLRKQVNRWGERAELEKELRLLENWHFGTRFIALGKELKTTEPELKKLHEEIKTKETELRALEKEKVEVDKSEPEHREKIELLRGKRQVIMNKRAELQREIGRVEAQIELLKETLQKGKVKAGSEEIERRVNEVRRLAEKALGETKLENLHSYIQKIIDEIKNIFESEDKETPARVMGLEKSRENFISNIAQLDKELRTLEEEENNFTKSIENFNQEFRKVFERMDAKRREIEALENKEKTLLFEKERIELKRKDLEEQLGQIGRNPSEFEKTDVEAGEEVKAMSDDGIMKRMFRLRSELAGIGDVDEGIVKEAKETESRFEFLENQIHDLEIASGDLKNLIKDLDHKVHTEFEASLRQVNEELAKFIQAMFEGGKAKLKLEDLKPITLEGEPVKEPMEEMEAGIEVEVMLAKKRIGSLDLLSGGERSLLSIAILFALVSVSPPPFLVLDEVDAALDSRNAGRFGELLKEFAKRTQFIIVTHNQTTMTAANVLYGVTMGDDGTSKVVSLKLEK
ncbi:MAG: hypothetical protein A3F24_01585 [Candidatus Colwellbacteria bacterium RIFCSPHIGHO2_12_FULL_44_17]|uniref:RecF/RecN/SMC N-terminal domain-containing protein n=2 Tax=Candidatus Colwelliibacteriota TaxID=1817904 RepID=A0A1G1Z5E5_9BACT|nr:MAG: hypothetical protein A3F24_01585 [Candidatus Colwellbacteria bacterium RIFCSPHIGHO2_12_FULL_44_17]OGY59861.1 MAG: hypothetical protein A3I31_02770 [Candidatus Colwellbacteria bacterium RIFCSPLOWO2_02_FULL_44_20b]